MIYVRSEEAGELCSTSEGEYNEQEGKEGSESAPGNEKEGMDSAPCSLSIQYSWMG